MSKVVLLSQVGRKDKDAPNLGHPALSQISTSDPIHPGSMRRLQASGTNEKSGPGEPEPPAVFRWFLPETKIAK